MDAHITGADLRRWKRGEVSPAEVVTIARHLGVCAECRARGEEEWSPGGVALDLAAMDEHPAADELFAYAEGKLDPARRASVASHVLACARCREDVEDANAVLGPPRHRRTRWRIVLAAAAALIAVIAAVFLLRPRAEQPPGAPRTASSTTTAGTASSTAVDEMGRLDPSLLLVARSLLDGRIPAAAMLAALHPRTERERSTATHEEDFSVLRPAGLVIGDDRPLFEWRGGAGRFTVEVFDERLRLLAESPAVSAHQWRPADPLPRRQLLLWEVRLDANGESRIAPRPPDPPARFRIAPAEAIEAARSAKTPLEAALIYAREGMIDEARLKMREASGGSASGDVRRMLATLDAAADQRSRPTTMNGAQ